MSGPAAPSGRPGVWGLARGVAVAVAPFVIWWLYGVYGYKAAFLFVVALLALSRAPLLMRDRRLAGTVGLQMGGLALYFVVGYLLHPHPMYIKMLSPFINTMLMLSFLHSLYRPPSMIERFARLQDPHLPPEGVVYCRKVTWIWVWFFFLDSLLVIYVSLTGTMLAWAVLTGGINYLLVGLLLGGEWLYRRRWGPPPGRRIVEEG
ncbi:MAG: hypothetical protein HQK87_03780 [Nitrospinae bacterium]|nr:hypothetical protein [Nitrospinota bacterium]